MDELYASGIKLAYTPEFNFIYENGDETEISKVKRNSVNCPSLEICLDWAKNHKIASILLLDTIAEAYYSIGEFFGENSQRLLCKLEDGVVYSFTVSLLMFPGDPLAMRFNEIFHHIIESGIEIKHISQSMHKLKIFYNKMATVHQLDGYYSFNLYHMQPAFFLLLMGWCLSAFCFMFEVLYNGILSKGS
jgi:hypothetical protein